jgi:hypothetical protein
VNRRPEPVASNHAGWKWTAAAERREAQARRAHLRVAKASGHLAAGLGSLVLSAAIAGKSAARFGLTQKSVFHFLAPFATNPQENPDGSG